MRYEILLEKLLNGWNLLVQKYYNIICEVEFIQLYVGFIPYQIYL